MAGGALLLMTGSAVADALIAIALGLLLLEERERWPAAAGSVEHAVSLAEAMVATAGHRAAGTVAAELRRRRATGGTTHVSVSDGDVLL